MVATILALAAIALIYRAFSQPMFQINQFGLVSNIWSLQSGIEFLFTDDLRLFAGIMLTFLVIAPHQTDLLMSTAKSPHSSLSYEPCITLAIAAIFIRRSRCGTRPQPARSPPTHSPRASTACERVRRSPCTGTPSHHCLTHAVPEHPSSLAMLNLSRTAGQGLTMQLDGLVSTQGAYVLAAALQLLPLAFLALIDPRQARRVLGDGVG